MKNRVIILLVIVLAATIASCLPSPDYFDDGSTNETDSKEYPVATVISISASDNDGNLPINVLDDDLSTRWSAYGIGQYLIMEFGEPIIVNNVGIAWQRGDERYAMYELQTSNDGINWETHINTITNVLTLQHQYNIINITTRYLKIIGYGNNISNWNSITGVYINDMQPNYTVSILTPDLPSCTDGIMNGEETDIDCGGSCSACDVGKTCAVNSDCVSGSTCTSGTCTITTTSFQGITYYVATSGKDSNSGTSSSPFATLQHAIGVAGPGNRIIIRPGTYQERVVITKSGTQSNPIIIQGEPGAIIDGGTRITGWQPAPEVGTGVYKTAPSEWRPGAMFWNGKFIPELSTDIMESGSYKSFMTVSSLDSSWDLVGARYGYLNGLLYIRLRGGQNPNDETDIKFSPRSGRSDVATVTLRNANFIVIRGLTMRNGYRALQLTAANDNIIENNKLIGGVQILEILSGSARNHIRGNEITLDYYSPHVGDGRQGHYTYTEIWKDLKGRKRIADPNAVRLYSGGADNHFYNNYIHHVFEAIGLGGSGNQRTKVYNNTIRHIHDSGIELDGNLVDLEIYDNVIAEAMSSIRGKSGFTEGPAYVYRNKLYNTVPTFYGSGNSGQGFTTWDIPGTLYFYHNSISNAHRAIAYNEGGTYSTNPYATENFHYINNVFSAPTFVRFTGSWPVPKAVFDYNWVGGTSNKWPESPKNNVLRYGSQMWPYSNTNLVLPSGSPARNAGVDLSKTFVIDGKTYSALPGMQAGYFTGTRPHIGAVQD